MPIKAILNGHQIYSFQYSGEQWKGLKANYKKNGDTLMMYCCDTPAVPKTSQLGLQFFAHKVSGDCFSQAESPEHEFVKFEIAKAVHELKWLVETEKSGVSDKGDEWRADVFCSKGGIKIAFEVQNSRQNWDEIKARQKRYAESGVRCAWFLNKKSFKIDDVVLRQSKEMPAFAYKLEGVGIPTQVDFFDMTAGEFAVQLLSKKVNWIDRERFSKVSVCEHECWKCNEITKSIIGLAGSSFQNGDELSGCIKAVKERVELPRYFMDGNGIGAARCYKYKNGSQYFSPVCFNCKTVQGVHQLSDDLWGFVNPYNGKGSLIKEVFQVELPTSCHRFGGQVPGYWEHNGNEMKYPIVVI